MKQKRQVPLLFEIGCEEIPARMLGGARIELGNLVRKGIQDAGLAGSGKLDVRAFATPRRLAVYVPSLLGSQPDQVEEMQGPPARVAYDANGQPTPAAAGFARKCGVGLDSLERVSKGGGEYVMARRVRLGKSADDVLPALLEDVISRLSFPATMYWLKKSGPRFIRPVRWILALLGEGRQARVIKLAFGDVKASDATFGHRRQGRSPIRLKSFRQYSSTLAKHGVLIETNVRRELLEKDIKVLVDKYGYKCIQNKELVEWIVNSTEWPSALLGDFDPRFLSLPRELLITVMHEHQKYLAVQGRNGKLQPRFVAVLDWAKDSKGTIRRGHERVLEARFRDAQFFWEADQRVPFASRLDLLRHVTFHSKLGSYWDKIERMKILGQAIISELPSGKISPAELTRQLLPALELAKCDLTTDMVKEFPSLQGVMGGLYAASQGEAGEVADAVYDHYLPVTAEDSCPRALLGILVSLVDKLDNVLAGYAAGLEPSGSSDPFALRRQGNGIIKLLIENNLVINLQEVTYKYFSQLFSREGRDPRELEQSALRFFLERVRFVLESSHGYRYDTLNAVLAVPDPEPLGIFHRAGALEAVRESEDFVHLSMAAKRIANLITKSAKGSDWTPGMVDPSGIEPGPEEELYSEFVEVEKQVKKLVDSGRYEVGLRQIAGLRPRVDYFFDKVLVMSPDPAIRQNRLRLLSGLDRLFSTIARFSEVIVAPD